MAIRAPDARALHGAPVTIDVVARMAVITVLGYVGVELRQYYGTLRMELVEHIREGVL